MLDHMSGGRFLLGVGRGISVWELAMYGYTQPETRDMFREALDLMLQYFTSDMVTHRGFRWRYFDVPVEIKPLQKPYPPLWYGSSSGASRDYVAGTRHGDGGRLVAQRGDPPRGRCVPRSVGEHVVVAATRAMCRPSRSWARCATS